MRTAFTASFWALATSLMVFATASAADYDTLVAQAKNDVAAADFDAIRHAYVQSPRYDPYGSNLDTLRKKMRDAADKDDCGMAQSQAQQLITASFIDIEAHMVASVCYRAAADTAAADREGDIAQGLASTILNAGDGRSFETAFDVVTLAEEYALIGALGLQPEGQALIQDHGHSYDRFDIITRESARRGVIFFKIDSFFTSGETKPK